MSRVSYGSEFAVATLDDSRPDAHGQAALLLVESLIHALLDRSGLSPDEAAEIVQTAIDVQAEEEQSCSCCCKATSSAKSLLTMIALSLRTTNSLAEI